jgi:hypothetical protein
MMYDFFRKVLKKAYDKLKSQPTGDSGITPETFLLFMSYYQPWIRKCIILL